MKTDFKLLLSKLVENDFDFIVIGEFAAAAYGSSFVTSDLDVCAVLTPENIEKLRMILADIQQIANRRSLKFQRLLKASIISIFKQMQGCWICFLK